MKIAICDDEQKDLERLFQYCRQFDREISVGSFRSGSELLTAFEHDFYDLVFLDIEMAEPNGLAVGQRLVTQERPPLIVFTTQSLNYAVRGYGIAIRYLTKPIDYDTFVGTMRIAADKLDAQKLTITNGGKTTVLSICDISYFEVFHHEVTFHMRDRKTIHVKGSLSNYMEQLARFWFVQPHKSYCVNMDHIDHLTRQTITMTNGETVPIGRNMSDSFRKEFDAYLRGVSAV